MRIALGALLFLAFGSVSLGQEAGIDPELERGGKKAIASFECAILAAEGTDAIKSSASPLALQGHAGYMPLAEVFASDLIEASNGPLTDYLTTVNAEFLVALLFAQSSEKIKKLLDEVAPFDGTSSYETVRTMRDWQADLEYGRRNCALLLP